MHLKLIPFSFMITGDALLIIVKLKKEELCTKTGKNVGYKKGHKKSSEFFFFQKLA